MKYKVKVSKSWSQQGQVKTSNFEITTEDPKQLFKNLQESANYLAKINKGKVNFQTGEKNLYINYLDVPGIQQIDATYQY